MNKMYQCSNCRAATVGELSSTQQVIAVALMLL